MHGRLVPHYQLYLGGDGMAGGRLARKGPSVPVARIESAIDRIVKTWEGQRSAEQKFFDWVHAQADDYFKALLADIVEVKAEELDSVLRDVDGEVDFKVAQLGGGECAGVSQVFIGAAFFAAGHERRYRDAFRAQGKIVEAAACAAATLRLIGQGINDIVNPAASFRVRKVLTDLNDLATALDGKTPEALSREFARFAPLSERRGLEAGRSGRAVRGGRRLGDRRRRLQHRARSATRPVRGVAGARRGGADLDSPARPDRGRGGLTWARSTSSVPVRGRSTS